MNSHLQNQNNIQEKAWTNMKAMLDKEMPEKKKRRPLFWLFFGLVLSIGLLYLTLNIQENKSSIDKAKLTEHKNAIANTIINSEPTEEFKSGHSISEEKVASDVLSYNSKTERIKPARSIINNNENASSTRIISNSLIESNTESSIVNETNNNQITNLAEISNKTIEHNENFTLVNNGTLKIQQLPIVLSHIIPSNKGIEIHAITEPQKENSNSNFDLFLTGGIGTYSYKNAELSFLGIRTSNRISNRFSIGSGLTYNTLYKDNDGSIPSSDITTGSPDISSLGDVFVFSSKENTYEANPINSPTESQFAVINKISYLRLPILLEFKLNKIVDIFTGPQLNYLSTIKSDGSKFLLQSNTYTLTYNNQSVHRFYPSYTAGFRINPWKRFSLDLAVNYDKKINLTSNNSNISALAGLSFRLF